MVISSVITSNMTDEQMHNWKDRHMHEMSGDEIIFRKIHNRAPVYSHEIQGSSRKSQSCLSSTDMLGHMKKMPTVSRQAYPRNSDERFTIHNTAPVCSIEILRSLAAVWLWDTAICWSGAKQFSLRETGARMRETTSSALRVNSQGRSFIEGDPGIEKVNVASGCK